jgi:hypothetical protein
MGDFKGECLKCLGVLKGLEDPDTLRFIREIGLRVDVGLDMLFLFLMLDPIGLARSFVEGRSRAGVAELLCTMAVVWFMTVGCKLS